MGTRTTKTAGQQRVDDVVDARRLMPRTRAVGTLISTLAPTVMFRAWGMTR